MSKKSFPRHVQEDSINNVGFPHRRWNLLILATGLVYIFVFYIMKLPAVWTCLSLLPHISFQAEAAAFPAHNKIISLDGYGKFTGTQINQTLTRKPLPAVVDAWLGIDFASQPVGENRFKAVGWPAAFEGIRNASSYGKACIQDAASVSFPQDEACLNLNVYRTAAVAFDEKLPVLVWIHGGSFVIGSGRSIDGAAFVANSKTPIMVVSVQYRLNSLGFLPSKIFEDEGLLNLGLLDQKLALEFVQKYISSFGGDPGAVTLGGRSAGSHSVGIHYFHNYGVDAGKPLFSRAIMQSGSVTARAFPNATYPLYERQFAEYMAHLSCPTNDSAAALACLRQTNISDIRYISSKIYSDSEYNITWPFQPTLGGPLLERPGSVSGIEGTFHHVPVITSTTTDEGKFYTPGDLEGNEEFLDFLHNISPALTSEDVETIGTLYPDPLQYPQTSPYTSSPNSTQFNRVSAAWSDYGYICPGQETAYRTSTAGVPTWKVRFNTPDNAPAWRGVSHTSDTRYTWSSPDAQYAEVGQFYHGYLASFVASGNPNTYRFPGSPEWLEYMPVGYGLESEPAAQLVVNPGNATIVELDDIRREQCLFWRDPERASRLNK
ncbi:para-nitrobenzyl esterase [Phlyctema vagabunda]|uniref:Carboxylic ester hydrolase n=1 Tax=Phlyctema vagabunda TaxID=108571 RepID=A0ABR4PVS9_9HELO